MMPFRNSSRAMSHGSNTIPPDGSTSVLAAWVVVGGRRVVVGGARVVVVGGLTVVAVRSKPHPLIYSRAFSLHRVS